MHTFIRFYSLDVHILWALKSLSRHPRLMSEAVLVFVCTHNTTLRGLDTSSVAALVFLFPIALKIMHSIESNF